MEFLPVSYQTGTRGLPRDFWTSMHKALGTKLKLSSTYHPQTNGQTERTIQTLEDLLVYYRATRQLDGMFSID